MNDILAVSLVVLSFCAQAAADCNPSAVGSVMQRQTYSGYVLTNDTFVGMMDPSQGIAAIKDISGVVGGSGWESSAGRTYARVDVSAREDGKTLCAQFKQYEFTYWGPLTKCLVVEFRKDSGGCIYARAVKADCKNLGESNYNFDFSGKEQLNKYTSISTSDGEGGYGVKNLSFSAPVLATDVGDIIVENSRFRLKIGGDAIVKSLVSKKTGEELLDRCDPTPFFSVTQARPFNNEIKLCHVNARTTYPANRVRRDGSRLVVGFETAPYEAVVDVKTTDDYVAFELVDFILTAKSYPISATSAQPLDFTAPPVEEFRLVQLPVKDRANFGEWLNVCWDNDAAVGVFATSPHAQIGAERRNSYRLMCAAAMRDVKLRGVSAAIAVDDGGDAMLGRVAALECDYELPRGVENRRNPLVNASIYFATGVTPETIDRHIEWAKKGGFRLMEMTYHDFFGASGDYAYNWRYPNGAADVKRKVVDKVRAAGIVPGLHILHTFVGFDSGLVRGGADRRLLLREHYTLAKPLGQDDTEVFVDENTQNAERSPKCRLLKFGREIMSYEGFTANPPYKFTGVRRGVHGTPRTAHEEGTIGGTLWICEYGGNDIYLKQDSDLQDVVADKVADFWKAGFGFIYFDGSEGVPPPFGYNVPNAQYRVWKKLDPQPILGEGAAKAHFGWHMLSGANAFDVFPPESFKAKIDEYPLAEAPLMKRDFTRVNFGWWGFWSPSGNVRGSKTIGVQPDMWEYGTSKAAAWDSPASIQMNLHELRAHPRSSDILETMRRWEDVRAKGWLTAAQKEALKEPGREFHLYMNDAGAYELVEWKQIPVGGKTLLPGLRAFLFERGGKRVVAYWHTSGRAKYALADNAGTVVEADGIKYFETSLSVEAAMDAFAKSMEISGNHP